MKLLDLSIKDNVLKYNGRKIVMKRKIIDYIIVSQYVVILEEYTGDDFDVVYLYDDNGNLFWKIKAPDSKFIGKIQLPYHGLCITQQGLTVVDTRDRYFIIKISTGEIIDMFFSR